MKKSILLNIVTTLAILGTGVIQAQTQNDQGLLRASTLKGKDVVDPQGNRLGHIERVLIDPASGRVRYAVLEVDKAWNWGDPKVAVPFQAFQVERKGEDDVKLTLDATKEKLQNAPKFKDGDADRIYSREASRPIYSYWAIMWYDDQPGRTSAGSQPQSGDQRGANQQGGGTQGNNRNQ